MRDAEWNERMNAVERAMLARITKNGWTFMGVPDGKDGDYDGGFIYTIGFTPFGKPELIVYLPPLGGGTELIEMLAHEHNKTAFLPKQRWSAPGAEGFITFRDEPTNELGMARRIYGTGRVRALRVGWQRVPGGDEVAWRLRVDTRR